MKQNKTVFITFLLIFFSSSFTTFIEFLEKTNEFADKEHSSTELASPQEKISSIIINSEENIIDNEKFNQEIVYNYSQEPKISHFTAWLRTIGINCFLHLIATKEYVAHNINHYYQKLITIFYNTKKQTHGCCK